MSQINYIVSGLERSGTSLMMQILKEASFPIVYDETRSPDEHNPNGYFELYDGKIINHLSDIDMKLYDGKAIKITSYGLNYLPEGNYKIIYMIRNIEEVYESQKKMIKNIKDSNHSKKRTIELLDKVNKLCMVDMTKRLDINVIYIDYNNLMNNPELELKKLSNFLGKDIMKGMNVIDKKLWRNRSIDEM